MALEMMDRDLFEMVQKPCMGGCHEKCSIMVNINAN